jgi:hypothetical protein
MSHNSHGTKLEPRLRVLDKKLSSLVINEELFKIIHRPGWTTPAELFFVTNLLDQIEASHFLLLKQLNVLYEGSNLIK